MNVQQYIQTSRDEKPLDTLLEGGGYVGIFRTLAVVGDSLSSGEFEGVTSEGNGTYHDMYDYSWGAYLGRTAGCTVHNFSRGGMTAKEYMTSYAAQNDYWNEKYRAQGYILALGVNDLYNGHQTVGSTADICREDASKNADTFAGWYARIIQKYKSIEPNAKFFLMTTPRELPQDTVRDGYGDAHRKLLYDMADFFDNCYVIDLRAYAPVYDETFKKNFYLRGHMNPMGYLFTARMVVSYIDYIIRHNFDAFRKLGFVGSGWENEAGLPVKEQSRRA